MELLLVIISVAKFCLISLVATLPDIVDVDDGSVAQDPDLMEIILSTLHYVMFEFKIQGF
jgi:hypothetical protein